MQCIWATGLDGLPVGSPSRVRFAFDVNNKLFTPTDLDWFEERIGPLLPNCEEMGIPPVTGRLSCSAEGAGKRRIFAICNYVNQRLLRPVHDWLMAVLRRIPQDGTFDQTKPLDRLVGEHHSYSFDLKSATDRWPSRLAFRDVSSDVR